MQRCVCPVREVHGADGQVITAARQWYRYNCGLSPAWRRWKHTAARCEELVPPPDRTDATVRSARATAAPEGVTIIAPASKQSSRARASAAVASLCTMAKVRGRLFLH
mgnify:CR=1 FL=1